MMVTGSPFEKEVAKALEQRGMEVRRQIGCSGYRIDLALMDPKNPGRFLLGIRSAEPSLPGAVAWSPVSA